MPAARKTPATKLKGLIAVIQSYEGDTPDQWQVKFCTTLTDAISFIEKNADEDIDPADDIIHIWAVYPDGNIRCLDNFSAEKTGIKVTASLPSGYTL